MIKQNRLVLLFNLRKLLIDIEIFLCYDVIDNGNVSGIGTSEK